MYFLFSESLRSINDNTWLQLQLVYFVSESHEGSIFSTARKEGKRGDFRHVLVFFLFYMCRSFYKHSTNNAQTSNKYVGRKGIGLNCHGCYGPKWPN